MKNRKVDIKNYQSKSISALTQMFLWLFVFVAALAINIALAFTNGSDARESTPIDAEVTSLSGSGTETDPYKISTYDDLVYFANQVNADTTYAGQYVVLTNDITTDTTTWTPIGINGSGKCFSGTFDGRGHSITFNSAITITNEYVGLFGFIYGSATIKNIIVNWNGELTGVALYPDYNSLKCGGLVGSASDGAKIVSVIVNGNINASHFTELGGIVGYLYSSEIQQVIYNGILTDANTTPTTVGYVGGIIGKLVYFPYNQYSITDILFIGSGTTKVIGMIQYENSKASCILDKVCVIYNGALSSISKIDILGRINYYEGVVQIKNFYMQYIDSSTNAEKRININDNEPWNYYSGTLATPTDVTSQDLKSQSTYTGWDFVNTWTISPSLNDGYPMLQVFVEKTQITLTANITGTREFVVYILNADGSIYNQLVVGNNSNYTFKLNSGTTFTVFVYQTLYANCTINDEKTFKKVFTASGENMPVALKLSAPESVNNWIMI